MPEYIVCAGQQVFRIDAHEQPESRAQVSEEETVFHLPPQEPLTCLVLGTMT